MGRPVWRNWARTETARPARVEHPASGEEVAEAVQRAVRDGLRVKAAGAGHSFTGIAGTDGVLLRLDRMERLVRADRDRGLVTVQAGMPLHRLGPLLDAHGLAMENLGDIDRQTISGAISTGTHGTGARLGGLATQVHELELVLADGSLVRCSAGERPGLFAAARVGLGALGVITTVTLRCVPAFTLRATERPMPLGEVLDRAGELADAADHFEFYWFPYSSSVLTKRNDRLPPGTQRQPLPRWRYWWDDELISNGVLELACRAGTRVPVIVPHVNRLAARLLGSRTYSDASYRVFTSPRRVVFRESEWAVPRAAVADAVREIRRWTERSDQRIAFPIEVRWAAADDIWLSAAYGRDTAYVAVHQYHRLPHEPYLRAVQAIMSAIGGRPHWGKLHWLDAAALRPRYPRFADFVALRDKADPAGVFTNPYLDRVLGPAGREPP
ncbi:MAG TPA: D-arabinono-1,4-lactone oxidase [Streptosporangiaceae bacterium]|nr:D-arabinono-1,4-lactone oxidase [Streptosporangiaceae bacterium]